MKITYKNKLLEQFLIGLNILSGATVTATFVALFGFTQPLLQPEILYTIQTLLLLIFIGEKIIRFLNTAHPNEFWRANWYEVPLLLALGFTLLGAGRWFDAQQAYTVRHFAIGIYLVLEVVAKTCRTVVSLAAAGKKPAFTLIASFLVLIISGAGLLMLPKASAEGHSLGFVDAMFTSASAACVTGLVVKETGTYFSLMGQIVILSLIQLGGLGIVIFGAVFALVLGQALSLRESVAMKDLLSADTLGRIGRMIAFVFTFTILIEAFGAAVMFGMWDNVPSWTGSVKHQWFCSIFHSISAFCNAGFGLFSDNLISYNRCWGVYLVICPLIIIGGLGFGVLYDLLNTGTERVKRFFIKLFHRQSLFSMEMSPRMHLQTKIVLSVTACLIVFGMLLIVLFENLASGRACGVADAFFQSVTARTAGFNTVDIAALTASSQLILILLMFIGGSPSGTAGGIKTVTLAIIIMAVAATLRKRDDVEMFGRSVRLVIIRRAIAVTLLFILILFAAALALSITERSNNFTMMQIMFETASALGTVGLSTGITGSLTTAGKLIIMVVMLIGRLGPLTLLASLTFNIRPAKYHYPEEAVMVG